MIKTLIAFARRPGTRHPLKFPHPVACACLWLAAATSGARALTAGDWTYSGSPGTPIPAEIAAPVGIVKLAVRGYHGMALLQDGSVVSWASTLQVPPEAQSGVIDIANGEGHGLALKQDGSVIAWGSNSQGETTVPVEAQSGVIAVAATNYRSLALKQNGGIVAWGQGYTGVPIPAALQSGVTAMSGGLFLKQDGSVLAWGGTSTPTKWVQSGAVAVASGYVHSAVLMQDGSVRTWGSYFTGGGGVVEATEVPLAAKSGVVAIAAGYHTVALKQDGSVVSWGYGDGVSVNGQTGVSAITASYGVTLVLKQDGTGKGYSSPSAGSLVVVPAGIRSDVTALAMGGTNLALKQDGSVLAWNGAGLSTVPVAAQSGVSAIAAGSGHSLALKQDGTVVAWGSNSKGQTTLPPALAGVSAIAAGTDHSLALKQDGSVAAWGDNQYGQTTVPAGLSGVIAIAAGSSHSLALKQDGSVVAWGSNSIGQTTVPEAALSGVVAIAAGSGHNLALKQDGSVIAWGQNNYGQCTVPAAALSGVFSIAAGRDDSVAIKLDGSVVKWGGDLYSKCPAPAAALKGTSKVAIGEAIFYRLGSPMELDQDGDGLNDVAEIQLAALGFDRRISQPAMVSALFSGAANAGLYTKNQVQALHPGKTLISRSAATGKVKLTLDWKKATDLTTFTDFPASPAAVSVNGAGDIEFEFTPTDTAAFFRLDVE